MFLKRKCAFFFLGVAAAVLLSARPAGAQANGEKKPEAFAAQDDPNREVLRLAKVPTDGPGRLRFLEKLGGNDDDLLRLDALIAPLGDAQFAKRTEAAPTATFGGEDNEAEKREVAKWIRDVGGFGSYDPQFNNYHINLSNAKVSDGDLAKLSKLGNPWFSLYLNNTAITDAGMRHLGALGGFSTLELRNTKITDNGLKQLGRVHALHHLDLYNTQVTDAGLAVLAKKEVKRIDLGRTQVTGIGLRQLTDLEVAGLAYSKATGAGLKGLAGLNNLRYSTLDNTLVTDDGLREIVHLNNLQGLGLSKCRLTDGGMVHIAKLQNLRILGLRDCQITDIGMKDIGRLQGLTFLDLSGCGVTDRGLKDVGSLHELTVLDITGCSVTNRGLKELAECRKLVNFKFTKTKVTDEGLAEITGFVWLETIDLTGLPITDAGMKDLAKLKQFQELSLEGTKVTDLGMKTLAEEGYWGRLNKLNLASTAITGNGLKELGPTLPRLYELNLASTRVNDGNVKGLAGVRVIKLNLAQCDITDAGLAQILIHLRTQQINGLWMLPSLDLSGTRITDKSLRELAGLPREVRGPGEVNLRKTTVSAEAVEALRKARPSCIVLH